MGVSQLFKGAVPGLPHPKVYAYAHTRKQLIKHVYHIWTSEK